MGAISPSLPRRGRGLWRALSPGWLEVPGSEAATIQTCASRVGGGGGLWGDTLLSRCQGRLAAPFLPSLPPRPAQPGSWNSVGSAEDGPHPRSRTKAPDESSSRARRKCAASGTKWGPLPQLGDEWRASWVMGTVGLGLGAPRHPCAHRAAAAERAQASRPAFTPE